MKRTRSLECFHDPRGALVRGNDTARKLSVVEKRECGVHWIPLLAVLDENDEERERGERKVEKRARNVLIEGLKGIVCDRERNKRRTEVGRKERRESWRSRGKYSRVIRK